MTSMAFTSLSTLYPTQTTDSTPPSAKHPNITLDTMDINKPRIQFSTEWHWDRSGVREIRSASVTSNGSGYSAADEVSFFASLKAVWSLIEEEDSPGSAKSLPVIYSPSQAPFDPFGGHKIGGEDGPMRCPSAGSSGMTSASSSRSSSAGVDRSSPNQTPCSRSNSYSYEGIHSLANKARERYIAQSATICSLHHTDTGPAERNIHHTPSCVSGKHKSEDYYIRRAQERIKSQQPTRRPRIQDLVDMEAEALATTISSSYSHSSPSHGEDFTFSFDPHFPDDLLKLALERDDSPLSKDLHCFQPRWSSGWDGLLDDDEPVVHAPRAIKPLKLVEMLETLLVSDRSEEL